MARKSYLATGGLLLRSSPPRLAWPRFRASFSRRETGEVAGSRFRRVLSGLDTSSGLNEGKTNGGDASVQTIASRG